MSQEQLKSACVKAFKKGNKQDAERLLPLIEQPAGITTYFSPDVRFAELVTLLHLATHHGWMDIIIDLITKCKCDTNCKDSQGRTPLHYAVINNHLEVVKYFINEQHCDPMTRDNDGDTPLHLACGYDYLKITQYFMNETHCNPSCENINGNTPLHLACANNHKDTVQYLLSTGKVNPLTQNKDGRIPLYKIDNETPSLLHLAVNHGWVNIIIDLITKYKCITNCKDSHGCTPLHYAVINNQLEVLRIFLNGQHCDPMTKDNGGNTPLHYACRYGNLHIAQYLISEAHCDPSCENNDGDTPLHYACNIGHLDIAQYLISEAHCDPSCVNNDGETPLHIACRLDHIHIVRYLISTGTIDLLTKNKNGEMPLDIACRYDHAHIVQYLVFTGKVNPLAKNNEDKIQDWTGNQLPMLHLAAHHGWMDLIIDLITKYKCDTNCKDSRGRTPLHYAAIKNHLEVVRYFINEQHYDPMTRDQFGDTPLHLACDYGHFKITQYLISEAHCNPSCENNDGDTPLHIACRNNHIRIVQYLLSTGKVDPLTKNKNGDTPLHIACNNGYLNITQYLISEAHCNPSCENNNGNTPLHIACQRGHNHIVQYLLSTGKVDLLAKNKFHITPVDYASRHDNSYDLLKLFQSFPQCKRDFPVHTYTKLILTGYSGAGKTTISQLIRLLANKASGFFSVLSSGRVTNVECLTAGIIPLHVESKVNNLGNMVIYDFAGQQEYYSSHAAVLERIMKNSAAIFLCIVDLSQCMDKISESIHYWISFIENACSSAQGSSHVIIVGSHADLVKSSQELKEKSSLVENIAKSRVKQQLTYGGFERMDCRLSKTKEARHFRSLLSTSQQAILSSQPSMSLYCHVLYAFLRTKLRRASCTLQELTTALISENDYSYRSSLLTESLTSLNDKGLILFLQNQEHPESSWVVVEKEALLREVNGTLFAPDNFKQYRQVASNTGIVPIATLEELFPQYSSKMLVGCLESMEFCHSVDMPTLQATNLKATLSFPLSGANYLFFPSLVKEHRPDDLPSPRFGWCLGCSDPHQYFSNRFLHVLLLRLAFTFPLASEYRSPSSSLHGLERKCKVWRNGICWKSVSAVSIYSIIVEIVDLNRWVIVLVSEKTREATQTCSNVIQMVLDLQHQLCSAVSTCECLISPSLLDRYPFDALPDTDLFTMRDVAKSMLLHYGHVLDRKEGQNELVTKDALSWEPYYLLQPSSVCQLFKQSMASQPVPDPLLQEVLRYYQLPHQKLQDNSELKEWVNKHSIFAGRNPLVSCSVWIVL